MHQGNQRLVYSILRRKEVFLDLEALTLDASPHLKGASSGAHTGGASPEADTEGAPNGTNGSSSSPQQQQQDGEAVQDWVPSQEWLEEWKAKSRGPLRTPIRLIQHLLPIVSPEP